MSILPLAAAFFGGTVLAVLGYLLARQVLKRRERAYPLVSVVRQIFSVGYLAALFLIGRRTDWNLYSLLIGGALGLTVPALILTVRLLKTADKTGKTHPDGRDDNG